MVFKLTVKKIHLISEKCVNPHNINNLLFFKKNRYRTVIAQWIVAVQRNESFINTG